MTTEHILRLLKQIERIPHEQYVLHGSPQRRNVLIPQRPPPTARRRKELRQKAVYATSFVDLAIIYATICGNPFWNFVRKQGLYLYFPKRGYKLCDGYIHVCRRSDFSKDPLVSFSTKPVRPVKILRIPSKTLVHLVDSKRVLGRNC